MLAAPTLPSAEASNVNGFRRRSMLSAYPSDALSTANLGLRHCPRTTRPTDHRHGCGEPSQAR